MSAGAGSASQEGAQSSPFDPDSFERRLIWIVGSSRSGSTWLLKMLSEHQRVVPIDDPHLGHHLGVWRPISLAWGTAAELPELHTLREVKRGHRGYFFSDRYRDAWEPALREMVRARFEAEAEEVAQTRGIRNPMIAVKDPGASGVAGLISELFPQAALLFLLRDGRDVVDSWLDAYRTGSWGQQEGMYPLSETGRVDFVRWQATVWLYRTEAVQSAYERHDPERRALVRYEELRRDPQRYLAEICLRLGIPTSAARLREIAENHSYDQVPDTLRGEGQRVRKAEPGSWRENLSAKERAAMLEVIGPKLRELGYERSRRFRKTA